MSIRASFSAGFAYSASRDSIVELRTRDEFESCDLTNPIRLYTGGLDKVRLEEEGTRYFTSSKPENCRNGLKLHVDVANRPESSEPKKAVEPAVTRAIAEGPKPSGSAGLKAYWLVWFAVGLLSSMSLFA